MLRIIDAKEIKTSALWQLHFNNMINTIIIKHARKWYYEKIGWGNEDRKEVIGNFKLSQGNLKYRFIKNMF